MEPLRARILSDGEVLPGGFLKVDGFLNHQIDPVLTLAMGDAFQRRFAARGVERVERVVTAETSGIAPALAAGAAWGAPVTFARKKRPVTMTEPVLVARAPSATKGGEVALHVSAQYLRPGERVVVIDDFLASGRTLLALAELIRGAGAELVGIGCVIEKGFQGGRARLEPLGVPIETLACIERLEPGRIELAEPAGV